MTTQQQRELTEFLANLFNGCDPVSFEQAVRAQSWGAVLTKELVLMGGLLGPDSEERSTLEKRVNESSSLMDQLLHSVHVGGTVEASSFECLVK